MNLKLQHAGRILPPPALDFVSWIGPPADRWQAVANGAQSGCVHRLRALL